MEKQEAIESIFALNDDSQVFNIKTERYERWGDIKEAFIKEKKTISTMFMEDDYCGFMTNKPIAGIKI